MDYFQGVVTEFLRANRSTFVNTEYLIQLDEGNTPLKARHWYCDALAVNFEHSTVYLCEITYSKTMSALLGRLQGWTTHWEAVCESITRDSKLIGAWNFQPWLFVPEASKPLLLRKLGQGQTPTHPQGNMPAPLITTLESVAPWNYCSWDRKHELSESDA
ncbi:hypothetical protein ACFPTX_13730 [Pseudomonas sp. GCM10022188]|uniref:hypothetical protein n=1 Tax=Pseudomonas TaxID=286 RepID=UPI001E5E8769|nr:hypothetical protein [Pseudomonas oryzagri]MCC6074348.1 hypothetical protein [Pseudomonas oryzagri]